MRDCAVWQLSAVEIVDRVAITFSAQPIDFAANTKIWIPMRPLNHAAGKSGCLRSSLDINDLIFHAANFSLGLSPALDANRTNMSKLN